MMRLRPNLAVFDEFSKFAVENELGSIELDQCEMTYVNHLMPLASADNPGPVEEIVSLWAGQATEPWAEPLEDVSFNARYLLRTNSGEPIGRLTVRLDTLMVPSEDPSVLQLSFTARGVPPSADKAGVAAFHRLAHENIVRCFAGVTTKAAHKKWERIDV